MQQEKEEKEGGGKKNATTRGLDLRAADMWSMGCVLWAMAFGGKLDHISIH
jgi:hypothetical protein